MLKILIQKWLEHVVVGLLMHSKHTVCGIKKSRFVKEQEAKGLLSNLGMKTPVSKIPLLNVLF